jgi:hypothetical protein
MGVSQSLPMSVIVYRQKVFSTTISRPDPVPYKGSETSAGDMKIHLNNNKTVTSQITVTAGLQSTRPIWRLGDSIGCSVDSKQWTRALPYFLLCMPGS